MSREDTKEKIIEAACELFSTQGYDGVSIRAIARQANVNLAAVNYHFKNKAFLYGQIIQNAKKTLSDSVAKLGADPALSVVELAMGIYDLYLENAQQLRHTFAIILSDIPVDMSPEDGQRVGPPGEEVILRAIQKELGGDVKERWLDWAVAAIFSQIAHTALVSSTNFVKEVCRMQGEERFHPDTFRENIEVSVKAVMSYLKNELK